MKVKRFFSCLILLYAYVFSSCSVVNSDDIDSVSDNSAFSNEENYELNCKGINNLAADAEINIKNIENITKLTLTHIDKTNIEGISKFVNLKDLTIAYSDLAEQDISSISKNINSLTFFSCENVDTAQIPNTVSTLSLQECSNIDLNVISKLSNITSLSLTYPEITDPSKLCLLTQITTLELIGSISHMYEMKFNMSYISDLKNLKKLRVYNLFSDNFHTISKLRQLEELTYTNSSDITYDDLSALTKLKVLDTVDYYFKDGSPHLDKSYSNTEKMNADNGFISVIENMPDLRILRCKGYPYSKIEKCKKLKEGMFICDHIDLDDFENIKDLEKLYIIADNVLSSKVNENIKDFECYNVNTDFSFINNLINLEKLKIEYNNGLNTGTNMSYIGKCTKLKSLSIRGFGSPKEESFNISFISSLSNLEELYLQNIAIYDIEPISKLYNLKKLTLESDRLSGVGSLSSLKSLQYVNLSHNMISDINSLKDLAHISYLDLGNNEISQISSLDNLNSVKYLDISGNKIKDINVIANFENIEYLDMSDNFVCDITPVSSKIKLKYLNISNNKVSDSDWAYALNSLEILSAENFLVTDLDFLYDFPSLLYVNITYAYGTVDDEKLKEMQSDYIYSIPKCIVFIERECD